jgi:beta-lactamase superfamily II metal-dependent hydrolase
MNVFRLTMLPASEGDSLILSYGPDETEGSLRHVVIDGGRKKTWPHLQAELTRIAARGEEVELLLLSHIDADHIDGLLELAQTEDLPLTPKAVWYNSYDQLKALMTSGGLAPKGVRVADEYTKALKAKGWKLNTEFGGKAIHVEARPAPFDFAGLRLTLISPTQPKLGRMWKEWEEWRVEHPGLAPKGKRAFPATLDVEALSAPSGNDGTAPNGSSIALIAEFDGRRVLLGADAHPDVLLATLAPLVGADGKLALDLVKLPHHASRANVTRAVLELLDCHRFAISTSGAVFGHPDPEAIARVLKFGQSGEKTLIFNYASERTKPWDDIALKAKWDFACVFPTAPDTPIAIDI